jgi:hypothetical protein
MNASRTGSLATGYFELPETFTATKFATFKPRSGMSPRRFTIATSRQELRAQWLQRLR